MAEIRLPEQLGGWKVLALRGIENGNEKIAKAVLAASKKSQNAQILTINSMQSITEEQINNGINYLSLMRANLENLKKALN